jgi:Na+/H+ antiporter NhaD/arsenite permease-like protein
VIPFVSATLLYFLASSLREAVSRVDWRAVLFFATMFIAMRAAWDSGLLQPLISAALPEYRGSPGDLLAIIALSLALSQVLSNVPFVSLFSSHLLHVGADTKAWLALAMASTIAGNLTLLGAASNVIILEVLERKYAATIALSEFLKHGALVTAVNVLAYLPFILLL